MEKKSLHNTMADEVFMDCCLNGCASDCAPSVLYDIDLACVLFSILFVIPLIVFDEACQKVQYFEENFVCCVKIVNKLLCIVHL